jgi:hypothetical protein
MVGGTPVARCVGVRTQQENSMRTRWHPGNGSYPINNGDPQSEVAEEDLPVEDIDKMIDEEEGRRERRIDRDNARY